MVADSHLRTNTVVGPMSERESHLASDVKEGASTTVRTVRTYVTPHGGQDGAWSELSDRPFARTRTALVFIAEVLSTCIRERWDNHLSMFV